MITLDARARQLRVIAAYAGFFWLALASRNAYLGRPRVALAQGVGCATAVFAMLVIRRVREERHFHALVQLFCFVSACVVMRVAQLDTNGAIYPALPVLIVPSAIAYLVGVRPALFWAAATFVLALASRALSLRGLVAPEMTTNAAESAFLYFTVHVILIVTAVGARRASDRHITEALSTGDLVRRQASEVEKSRDEALAASRFKSVFLATMSHELRTPLNGVLGMASALLESELDDRQRQMVKTIRDSGQSLLVILNEVLDLTKIEAGHLEIARTPFRLARVIDEVALLFSAAASLKGLHLSTKLAEGLPEAVTGDEARLRQVLSNLIGNALKFTARGTIEVDVRRAGKGHAEALVFAVRDTGIGIPKERLPDVFDAFTQGDSSITRRFGGTGLGLTIVRELVLLMRGEVTVRSVAEAEARPDAPAGSEFRVVLPLPAADPAAIPRGAMSLGLAYGPARQTLFVLVAEDNEVNQRVARAMLEALGHRVDVVDCGDAALEAIERRVYDVLLTDMRMPGMSGLELTRRVREAMPRPLAPYVAAMTASAFAEERQAFVDAGMDYVAKPVSRAVLAEVLGRATDRRTRLDEGTLAGLAVLADGEAGAEELVSNSFASMEKSVAALEGAAELDLTEPIHLSKITRDAHSLIGTAGICGAFGVARSAMGIERLAARLAEGPARSLSEAERDHDREGERESDNGREELCSRIALLRRLLDDTVARRGKTS